MNSTQTSYNIRSIAAKTLTEVLEKGASLSTVLPLMQQQVVGKDKGLLQEICFGVLRSLPELDWFASQLMDRPLDKKQKNIHYLILVGFYQLHYMRVPAHAAISETVNAVVALKRPQLKGLINGVLRQFQRQHPILLERLANLDVRFWHPTWLLTKLKQAYPSEWKAIVEANNQKPPMWLRVNPAAYETQAYQAVLAEREIESHMQTNLPQALLLNEPIAVDRLPEFNEGAVTVQDLNAQYAVSLLAPQNDELILDLCAAPGGKTTHILEVAPKANVIAVELDEKRALRIKENLKRLHRHAEVIIADGTKPSTWVAGRQFNKILLDAPCSATGVIRRHPDIKWLRRSTDIADLVTTQYELLNAIWPYLKSGGTLIYVTCSILPEENDQQIKSFLAKHADAEHHPLNLPVGMFGAERALGLQLLPKANMGDGFYYAKLVKK
ncbi:16S rRNA (cytosine(967)-C(5))-methyltransferase RsmB [Thorsellia anophelis]|uniref:16S rRNA (cytosine(967)-C(5))-methyltransferase n=1 Tax=Thorsellia anophelis DSM 18579 TaxID=1123402 RepID=A0A1I0B1P1_9GAMM|nr:16S rRNA (cytosine(967)-C(5))-methyltransferase RsmB [Thorsellia anophelis]SET00622.1 16S rRNA m(5)C-967 methyltransferase [Thorsellia anophelis DSM 18579]